MFPLPAVSCPTHSYLLNTHGIGQELQHKQMTTIKQATLHGPDTPHTNSTVKSVASYDVCIVIIIIAVVVVVIIIIILIIIIIIIIIMFSIPV
jgi:hypothetical protein